MSRGEKSFSSNYSIKVRVEACRRTENYIKKLFNIALGFYNALIEYKTSLIEEYYCINLNKTEAEKYAEFLPEKYLSSSELLNIVNSVDLNTLKESDKFSVFYEKISGEKQKCFHSHINESVNQAFSDKLSYLSKENKNALKLMLEIKNNNGSSDEIPVLEKTFPLKEKEDCDFSIKFQNKNRPKFCENVRFHKGYKREGVAKILALPEKYDNLIFKDKLRNFENSFDKNNPMTFTYVTLKRECGDYYVIYTLQNAIKRRKRMGNSNVTAGIDMNFSDNFITIVDEYGNVNKYPLFEIDENLMEKQVNYYRELSEYIEKRKKEIETLGKEHKEEIYKKYASDIKRCSKNIRKTFNKMTNKRKKHYEKIINEITDSCKNLCVQLDDIKEMKRKPNKEKKGSSRYIRKAIQNFSPSDFVDKLIDRIIKNGGWVGRVDKYFPTSQKCSNKECGEKISAFRFCVQKHATCPHCGTYYNRDMNAAKNILNYGFNHKTTKYSLAIKRNLNALEKYELNFGLTETDEKYVKTIYDSALMKISECGKLSEKEKYLLNMYNDLSNKLKNKEKMSIKEENMLEILNGTAHRVI